MKRGRLTVPEVWCSDLSRAGTRRIRVELHGRIFAIHPKPSWCTWPGAWRVTHRESGGIVAYATSRKNALAKLARIEAITRQYRLRWAGVRKAADVRERFPERVRKILAANALRGIQ